MGECSSKMLGHKDLRGSVKRQTLPYRYPFKADTQSTNQPTGTQKQTCKSDGSPYPRVLNLHKAALAVMTHHPRERASRNLGATCAKEVLQWTTIPASRKIWEPPMQKGPGLTLTTFKISTQAEDTLQLSSCLNFSTSGSSLNFILRQLKRVVWSVKFEESTIGGRDSLSLFQRLFAHSSDKQMAAPRQIWIHITVKPSMATWKLLKKALFETVDFQGSEERPKHTKG